MALSLCFDNNSSVFRGRSHALPVEAFYHILIWPLTVWLFQELLFTKVFVLGLP